MRKLGLALALASIACGGDGSPGDATPLMNPASSAGVGGAAGSSPTGGAAASPASGAGASGRGGGAGAGTTAVAAGSGGMTAMAGMPAAGAAGAPVSGAGGSGGSGAGGAGGSTGDTGAQKLPPVTDYAQAGPFMTTMQSNTGPGSNYTIFRPEPLGTDGFLHSPVIFGPGIITTPSTYRALLTHLASHGFVILGSNSLTGGPNAPGNLDAMREGLDWLIEQNDAAGTFQGKLAVRRAVTMGYSIGATASVQLSSHEAILTSVVIHGHRTMGDPHGPVLMITGTMDVIDDMRATLTTLEEAPAVLVALPIGHLNVLTELSASGRYLSPITAWLRYWVNGDDAAKRYFWGAGCEMCDSPWIAPEPNAAWSAQTL